jgi:hypothetical protein
VNRHVLYRLAIDTDFAAIDALEASQQVQQGRFDGRTAERAGPAVA